MMSRNQGCCVVCNLKIETLVLRKELIILSTATSHVYLEMINDYVRRPAHQGSKNILMNLLFVIRE